MNITALDKCSNCAACVNVCARRAITVEEEGTFYSLHVNESLCNDCGACVKVCPVADVPRAYDVRQAWWGKHADDRVVEQSSSGGAFTAMADYVLRQNGVVFGACFDDDYQNVVIKSTEEVPLAALRKSKYVESLVGESFQEAKQYLREGRMVLFCGTPCQIAGLRRFLGKDYENLYTCDFSCGGTSSHGMYRVHLAELSRRYRSDIAHVDFRPKTYGWNVHALRVDFQNGKTYKMPAHLDPYCFGFVGKHLNTREYCYECRFEEHHESDVILADFWKYPTLIGKPHDNTGISLLLTNSEKGDRLLEAIRSDMVLEPLKTEDGSYNIRQRTYSEDFMNKRRQYLDAFEKSGLREANKAMGYTPSVAKTLATKLRHRLKGLKKRG